MQFSAIVHRFIVKKQLNSTFTNDLKRKDFFRKMFIVADLVSLSIYELLIAGLMEPVYQSGACH